MAKHRDIGVSQGALGVKQGTTDTGSGIFTGRTWKGTTGPAEGRMSGVQQFLGSWREDEKIGYEEMADALGNVNANHFLFLSR